MFGAVKQPFGINLATGDFKLTFYRPALDEMVDDVVSVQGAQSEYAAFEPNLGACGRRREHTGGDQPDRSGKGIEQALQKIGRGECLDIKAPVDLDLR